MRILHIDSYEIQGEVCGERGRAGFLPGMVLLLLPLFVVIMTFRFFYRSAVDMLRQARIMIAE